MSVRVDLGGRRIIKKIFFKQKTAYEILRSDWSSDVCSSDLESTIKISAETDNRAKSYARFTELTIDSPLTYFRAISNIG